ncbi:DUF4880 domain-containing protein [Caulobacter sp. CCNWLY153]|uniref:FecR family protein n=1 Tax=unclassified Caulobacter TaxID=2648921 RepID=UPI002FF354F7
MPPASRNHADPMSAPNTDAAALHPLEIQSLEWVNRLLSGQMSSAETEDLARWRAQSPEHEAAFAGAIRFRRAVRAAALETREQVARTAGAPQSARLPPPQPTSAQGVIAARRPSISRRTLIGGGVAASLVGYAALRSSNDLWPTVTGEHPDYRVAKGQRRSLDIARGVSAELNTDTRAALRRTPKGAELQLLSGEAAISADAPIVIKAARGETTMAAGRVNIRQDGGSVCVTCLEGEVRVSRDDRAVTLTGGRQVTYDRRGLSAISSIDPGVVGAWLKGQIVFRDVPLQQVVEEINRYRRGKIVLVDPALARRPVFGVFQISRIDGALDQVRRLTGAQITALPGGLVLLS